MKTTIGINTKFDAAHMLPPGNKWGVCERLHGHTWKVTVIISRDIVNDCIMDFKILKQTINDILPDHQYLNKYYTFVPTAENICMQLFKDIKRNIPSLVSVRLYENDDSFAEVSI